METHLTSKRGDADTVPVITNPIHDSFE
jgi:hypothetical protein